MPDSSGLPTLPSPDRQRDGRAEALFVASFGGRPAVVASAPGRVNLIGEHTDYNGGEVLPIAIDRRIWVAVGPSTGGSHRAVSALDGEVHPFDVRSSSSRTGRWWDYLAGVIKEFQNVGLPALSCEFAVVGDVPAGAGLSSSAALEVATGAALSSLFDFPLPPVELARIGNRAENLFVGVQSGIMDQFASALSRQGHALHLWCDTQEYDHVPMPDSVLIFDTRVPRSLRTSAFNQRRRECDAALAELREEYPTLPSLAAATPDQIEASRLSGVLRARASHVSAENRRVREAVQALHSGSEIPADLLYASHESLRTLYECSSPELDWFVGRVASEDGVRGARLTGAGWGGCAIALGDRGALEVVGEAILPEYNARFGHAGAYWITVASHGVETATSDN